MSADLAAVRSLFPVLARTVYFNHASCGPPPLTALCAVNGYLEKGAHFGQVDYLEAEAVVDDCRLMLARLMKVEPSTIAFTKNTSAGIIIGIGSLEWRAGDNVILMRDDFPTVTYPFRLLLPEV